MKAIFAFTVDVESWYHTDWFDGPTLYKSHSHNGITENLTSILKILDRMSVIATFFVLGEKAKGNPEIVELIADSGHEIGCHGFKHVSPTFCAPEIWKKDISDSRSLLEKQSKLKIVGYRAPNARVSPELLEFLSKASFSYDSSIIPSFNIPGWYGTPSAPIGPFYCSKRWEELDCGIIEFPISVHPTLRIPGAGGWWFRNLGYSWAKRVVGSNLKRGFATVYFHPWEFSLRNPTLRGIPFHVFRRTGKYVIKNVINLLKFAKKRAKILPLSECCDFLL